LLDKTRFSKPQVVAALAKPQPAVAPTKLNQPSTPSAKQ
jgi:hypothetical protein